MVLIVVATRKMDLWFYRDHGRQFEDHDQEKFMSYFKSFDHVS